MLNAELTRLTFRKAMFSAFKLALLMELIGVPLIAWLFSSIAPFYMSQHQLLLLLYLSPLFVPFALPLVKLGYRDPDALLGIGAGVVMGLFTVLLCLVLFAALVFSTMGEWH